MGYSCAQRADSVLKILVDHCVESTGSSNTWIHKGNKYFFDIGRENPDGAITGKVLKFIDDRYCVKAGHFRIDGNGNLCRFPALPADVRKKMKRESDTQVQFSKGELFVIA